jgi:putative CocE/NonD family hydrolase
MSYESIDQTSSIERHEGLQVPVDDKTVSATRYEPAGIDGPLPALLMYYPYRKDDHLVYGAYAPTIEYMTKHGYEVVTADMVGTGASTGRKSGTSDFEEEGSEGARIVEWLADQPWCNGRVGMFGKSYGGSNCLATAVQDPNPLDAMVPIMSGISSYEEVAYPGGVLSPFERAGHWNAQMLALQSLPSSIRDTEGQWSRAWKDHLEELSEGRPWLFNTMDHETKDEYWDQRELPVQQIETPAFVVSGWRDYFPAPTLTFAQKLPRPKRAILGPWRHAMPHRARQTTIDFRPQMAEWFDYFLKDVDNGALDHATIAFWTEREGGGTVEAGHWRSTGAWPPSDETLSYALSPDGLVQEASYDEGAVEVEYEHDYTVGMYSPDDRPFSVPADVTPDDKRSLCFETDPFDLPVELTGVPTATLRLESSIEDPTLVVRLVDVAPDGTARLVSHGRLRLSHRESHRDPTPLEPDEEYEITLSMKPKSHVFEEGHRLRLAVSASLFPLTLPTSNEAGRFTVRSVPGAPSTVRFPGAVHDAVSFDDRLEMRDPDDSEVPTASPYATSKEGGWKTSRDQLTGQAAVETVMTHAMELPHGGTMSFDQEIEATVEPDNPQSYVVRSETEAIIDYGTQRARSKVLCRVTPDTTQFTLWTFFDDHPVLKRTWTR